MLPARDIQQGITTPRPSAIQPTVGWSVRSVLVHSARMATAAMTSLILAEQFGLREAYWAAITTLVIEQSSLGTALLVSWHRFIGTLLGAALGAAMATQPIPNALAIGTSVFALGLVRALTHSNLAGYRFGAVTLAIVLLVPRSAPAWQVALHRFVEVSIGIGVALLLAAIWPERDPLDGKASTQHVSTD